MRVIRRDAFRHQFEALEERRLLASIVVNGGFETPDVAPGNSSLFAAISGWNLASGTRIEVQDNFAGAPAEGSQFVELDSNASSAIYQDLPTTPGQTYQLSFAFSPRPHRATSDNRLQVLWGAIEVANLQANGTNNNNTAWQTFTYSVTATSATTRLQFADLGHSNGFGTYIDNVNVLSANVAPVLAAIGNQTVNEQETLSFTASATDQDDPAQTLTYTLDAAAVALGMGINSSTGAFSWTPTESQDGSYQAVFKVTDSAGASDTETVGITVNEVNEAPTWTNLPNLVEVVKTVAMSFTAAAADSDLVAGVANVLAYSLLDPLGNAAVNSSTGEFTWTPTKDDGPDDYPFTIRVTDNGNPTLYTDATLTVRTRAAGIVDGNVLVVGRSLPDIVVINASSHTDVRATVNGEDYGPFSISGGQIFANLFEGDDTLSISGVVDADINMGGGNDGVAEEGDATYHFSDPEGADTYTLHGSTVNVTDSGGDDDYFEDAGDDSEITITDHGVGADTYTLHGSTVNVTDSGGDDDYFEDAGEGSTVNIDDHGEGADNYTLHGSTVNVTDSGGDDDYFEDAGESSTVSINDHGEGADTYTLHGSTVNVTDSGGDDDYFEDAEEGSTVTIDDHGEGADTYTLHGSTVNVTDAGGDDDYFEDADGDSTVSITDHGAGADTYTLHGSTVNVTDAGGDDDYFEEAEGGSTVIIEDQGGGDDTYTLHGSTVIVRDDSGSDMYEFTGSGSDITVEDTGTGENSLDLTAFDEALRITVGDSLAEFKTLAGTAIATFNGRVSSVSGSDFGDVIIVTTTSGTTAVEARGGDDLIDASGSSSHNTLDAGPGSDVTKGGSGKDTYVIVPGGDDAIIEPVASTSIDTLDFTGATLGITIDLTMSAGQWQTVDSAGNRVALTGTFENVIGSELADIITGNPANNRLEGRGENDILVGASGHDILLGGSGNDDLTGSAGRDVIIGGTGADRMTGSADEDFIATGDVDFSIDIIFGEWSLGSGSSRARRSRLMSSGLTAGKHLNDSAVDTIVGSSSIDWLLFHAGDVLSGNTTDDLKNFT